MFWGFSDGLVSCAGDFVFTGEGLGARLLSTGEVLAAFLLSTGGGLSSGLPVDCLTSSGNFSAGLCASNEI